MAKLTFSANEPGSCFWIPPSVFSYPPLIGGFQIPPTQDRAPPLKALSYARLSPPEAEKAASPSAARRMVGELFRLRSAVAPTSSSFAVKISQTPCVRRDISDEIGRAAGNNLAFPDNSENYIMKSKECKWFPRQRD